MSSLGPNWRGVVGGIALAVAVPVGFAVWTSLPPTQPGGAAGLLILAAFLAQLVLGPAGLVIAGRSGGLGAGARVGLAILVSPVLYVWTLLSWIDLLAAMHAVS